MRGNHALWDAHGVTMALTEFMAASIDFYTQHGESRNSSLMKLMRIPGQIRRVQGLVMCHNVTNRRFSHAKSFKSTIPHSHVTKN